MFAEDALRERRERDMLIADAKALLSGVIAQRRRCADDVRADDRRSTWPAQRQQPVDRSAP